ncbi:MULTISPECIES: hypothetical protein [unclassified Polaromonas]|jgi:hypothetical protein|uniref:hypothetical protein n=1 Tax=unclassified Polaromonas TaxID=2638319 RepID=UPI000BD54086|nr:MULTISPECIES: hypothetical protein [unclassified Polaromonas]OYZ79713.1 MAG: hypothetical protein B7Y09_09325 [Polaromonas sp. 24-63-21]OZA47293.1 MAG: hypothetical protein B7X88_22595 [Polaromonas sp. 17-63-33]HQS00776.1 hypothetical protein [Polaromonas sp.]HQS38957.1 hypothetical protein [Polaromonas sp.]HQT09672.1 hypothetical protein [Polaromonas sp.]
MPKPSRTAKQLQALIQERIDAIPELQGQVTDVQIGGVVWSQGGTGGNWTVPVLRSRDVYRADIARIIRQVQDAYDLED